MSLAIHPKTSGAALGSAAGVVIVGALHSFHGVHLAPELDAAIPAFLSVLGAFLSPSPDSTAPTTETPLAAPSAAEAPAPAATDPAEQGPAASGVLPPGGGGAL